MSKGKDALNNEIERRRTFAIISHPDAGKTTLTEKLLLYGGAIHMAGSVKARKASRHAVSDWMEIEKQRGISVTSSVMQFEYKNFCINILDTPGHQDFSEDTYRTLVAADSAVMLIDGAKGVEAQTIKLFQVCKMRGIPIFTFINKMDRASKDTFSLMQELEDVLGIRSYPMNWPIGTDGDFKGVYNRVLRQIALFTNDKKHGQTIINSNKGSVDDPIFKELLGEPYYSKLVDDIELLDIAGDSFDLKKVLKGELTPIFFGSAMTNFGVELFLEEFLNMSPPPGDQVFGDKIIDPLKDDFTGFIFKIQANMNPNHRDRLAFMRVCSGVFERGMQVIHSKTGKPIRLAQPQHFMAQDREVIDSAYPGDIVGLFDPGIFSIGDALSTNSNLTFKGIPAFPAEHFARVAAKDTMKRKQFLKGITQLSEEGAIQVYKQPDIGVEEFIIGAVGVLQFEVLEYRLKNEYGVDIKLTYLNHRHARWIAEISGKPNDLNITSTTMIVKDNHDNFVLLFENEWSIQWALDRNKGLALRDILSED
ncbi:MAG: peptide chain release factor 3 [Acetivibrionales bacterium]|nr:peptide chain release factor 3 [Clostridiaceae bacterium]